MTASHATPKNRRKSAAVPETKNLDSAVTHRCVRYRDYSRDHRELVAASAIRGALSLIDDPTDDVKHLKKSAVQAANILLLVAQQLESECDVFGEPFKAEIVEEVAHG